MKLFTLLLTIFTGFATVLYAANPMQKNMLTADLGYGSRFAVTDLVWPADHGEADVCLWADDKIAAVSLGVDDNTVPDHDWWMSMADKYGFKMTWWAVTDWFESEANPGFYGTYPDFQRLHDAGHEVGSHSWNHNCIDTTDDYWDEQMRVSNGHLNDNISGLTVKTYAGPCGKMPHQDTTAKHYISGRGVSGGINAANKIRYYGTKPFGTFDASELLSKTSTGNWWYSYRGWQILFWHYNQGNDDAIETNTLMPIFAKQDSLWIGRYDRVAMYGQSRDTHTLTVTGTAADLVTFTLTDSMNDVLFTYPLTVKVRLNNDWDTCIAIQNGSPVEATIVEHENARYALVKAVPDRGEVSLTKNSTGVVKRLSVLQNGVAGSATRYFDCRGRSLTRAPLVPGVYIMYTGRMVTKTVVIE